MRDRLIELIQDSVGGCAKNWAETIADHLIAEGVIVPPFPVKIGDTVYRLMCRDFRSFYIREETVWIVDVHARAGFEVITKYLDGKCCTYFPKVEKDDIGKTVFLTREEAEQALERREG